MMRPSRVAGIALALLFCSLSCDDDPVAPGGPDTTPPTLRSVEPLDEYHVVITFDEAVEPETAGNTNSYRMIESGGTDRLGIIGIAMPNGRTVVLATPPMLATTYELTVQYVEDLQGNTVAQITSTFQGSTEPDRTAPALIQRSPAPGETGVPLDQPIEVQFSDAVFLRGVTVTGGGDERVTGFTLIGGYDHYLIHAPLRSGTIYTVTISNTKDFAGNPLPTAKWSFTTTLAKDVTPPTLLSSSPENNDSLVSVGSLILLQFSEMIDQESFASTISPPIEGRTWWFAEGRELAIFPDPPLLPETEYIFTIAAGGMTDIAGNPNVEAYTIRFTTAAATPAARRE